MLVFSSFVTAPNRLVQVGPHQPIGRRKMARGRRKMARPRKPLVERCREGSFRSSQHWPMLAAEPTLPLPALAELQRQARAAEDDEVVKELARVFARQLDSLTEEELQILDDTPPVDARQSSAKDRQRGRSDNNYRTTNQRLLAHAEAVLSELDTMGLPLSARERLEVELIRTEVERLAEIDRRLHDEGFTVSGSKGQLRPHPLLSSEGSLRRELVQHLRTLEWRIGNRVTLERLKALTRDPEPAEEASSPNRVTEWLDKLLEDGA